MEGNLTETVMFFLLIGIIALEVLIKLTIDLTRKLLEATEIWMHLFLFFCYFHCFSEVIVSLKHIYVV